MRIFLATAAAAVLLAGSAQAALVANGSFENGTNPPGSGFSTLAAGSTDLAGWTIGRGGIDWIGGYWQAADGVRSIDISGNAPGSISQTLTTSIGHRYIVTFDLAGNPDGGPAIKSLDVSVNGTGNATYNFDTTGFSRSNMGWASQSYSFIATSTSSTLAFAGLNQDAYGAALDNVAVSQVPEAATWAMLIAGFGLVGAAARRRRMVVAA